jgi:hypothetical protein
MVSIACILEYIQIFRKVFTVPEAATVLLSGGVKFAELTPEQSYNFQRDLLATLLQIEQVRRVFSFQTNLFLGIFQSSQVDHRKECSDYLRSWCNVT